MSGKSAGGHQWLASCAQYNTVIPSVHYPTTVIFLAEEPKVPFDIVYTRILYHRMRVFTRRMPSRISQLPEVELTAQQLHSFKWTVRVIDYCVMDSLFFIIKQFSHSDAPRDLPIQGRRNILKSEPWIQRDSISANSVRCAGCTRKIDFEHTYSVLEWVAHRDICQGIEHRMMLAMFADWADATDEEDADPAEVMFDRPYKSVCQTFEYPLRYVRLPEYALDKGDIDDDSEYFADECDSASYGNSEEDLDEGSSSSSSVDALVQKAGIEPLFYAKESQPEIFALEEALKRAAQADDSASSETSSNDENYSPSDDDSSSISLLSSNLDQDEDGFPRWYSAEAYHPGYYDGSDDEDDDNDVEEDEEEVRYISYEEHLRLWAEKHPELLQDAVCSHELISA